jgi:hypothetical protein
MIHFSLLAKAGEKPNVPCDQGGFVSSQYREYSKAASVFHTNLVVIFNKKYQST